MIVHRLPDARDFKDMIVAERLEINMARQMILGVLVIVVGLVWGGSVGAQDSPIIVATPTGTPPPQPEYYTNPEAAYQEALRVIEETRINQTPKLALHWLPLETIPPELWRLTHLQTLTIRDTQASFLSSDIGNLMALTELQLVETSFTTLPAEIGQLKQLQTLVLFGTPLTALPPEIGQLSNLRRIDLRGTDITGLPPEFEQLSQLETLDISSDRMTELPSQILHLEQLKTLAVVGMPLTDLPDEFQEMHQLQTLVMAYTQMISLPLEITQLTGLRYLDISGNPITTLPPEIGQMTQLETLYMSNTSITAFPVEMQSLSKLTDFNINTLTFPPPEIVAQGTPAILAYLRDYDAMMVRQTVAGIAAGIGGIAIVMLAFRWRQRRGLNEKKKRA